MKGLNAPQPSKPFNPFKLFKRGTQNTERETTKSHFILFNALFMSSFSCLVLT